MATSTENKKFEIINNKWIKKVGHSPKTYRAIKISEIKSLSTDKIESEGSAIIVMGSVSVSDASKYFALSFEYSRHEFEQYEKDLKFFEDILFHEKNGLSV